MNALIDELKKLAQEKVIEDIDARQTDIISTVDRDGYITLSLVVTISVKEKTR